MLGLIARIWLWTLRVRVEVHPALADETRPWVLSFLHGKQWPLLAWKRRRKTLVMVSWSSDGQLQARALSLLGFSIVRGSSSRGGARALATLIRRLRGSSPAHDAAFAVDGPRGPYGVAKPGALLAARATGGVLVPMGSAIAHAKVFARAWDRFALAWPFTRVVVVLGAPLEAEITADALGIAIAEANAGAEAILSGKQISMVPLNSNAAGAVQLEPSCLPAGEST
jgi:lysophospholipid acyltransferase (LPLAT)-like uncharacterized protein